MHDKRDHARGWFLKAESNLLTARRLLETNGPYDTACFHAQQTAEKYLKGLLAWTEQPIPRTHNLEELEYVCSMEVSDLELGGIDLTTLTPYAV
jgi:HEPN domain-containing protein